MANKAGFSNYMQSDTIKITIDTGDNKTTFKLSIDLLKARSPYLSRKIQEAQTPTRSPDGSFFVGGDDDIAVRLPSVRLAPFKQFIEWILNQPLTVTSPPLLIDTYLLAHRFESVQMRNDLLNTLCEHHVANPGAPIGLPSVVKLADALPPDTPHTASRNLLLKFMVHQLTYKIFGSGWDAYRLSKPFESLMRKSVKIVYWHLDALHEMQKAACPVSAFVDAEVKLDPDGDGGEAAEGMVPRKRVKRGKGGWVPNPAVRGLEGCLYHEHPNGGGEAKCFKAVDLTEDGVLSD